MFATLEDRRAAETALEDLHDGHNPNWMDALILAEHFRRHRERDSGIPTNGVPEFKRIPGFGELTAKALAEWC